MKKIVSFSLFGSDPKYTIGAIQNAKIVSAWDDWECVIYLDDTVPQEIIKELENICELKFPLKEELFSENIMEFTVNSKSIKSQPIWRFYEGDSENTVIFRDTDSRITQRDKCSVEEWLNSDKDFHIIRDHPLHDYEILAGMWGCKNGVLLGKMHSLISRWFLYKSVKKGNFKFADQHFLSEFIFPLINDNNVCVHDPFFAKKPFPENCPKRTHENYIGKVFSNPYLFNMEV